MSILKKVAMIIAVLIVCATGARAEMSAEKKRDIEKLLQMTGATNIGIQMGGAVVQSMVQSMSKAAGKPVPQEVIDVIRTEFETEMRVLMPGYIQEMLVVYDRHLTHQDIKNFIAFYSTETGRKSIRVMPVLVQEGMQAGQRMGVRLQQGGFQERLVKRLEGLKGKGVN